MRARRRNSVRRPVIKGTSGLLRKWRNKYDGWILVQGKARRRVIAVATARSRNTALRQKTPFYVSPFTKQATSAAASPPRAANTGRGRSTRYPRRGTGGL